MTKYKNKVSKKLLKQVKENIRIILDLAKGDKIKVTPFNKYDEGGDYFCFNCEDIPNFKVKIKDDKRIYYYCGRCN